jgi:hypothetical protein
MIVFGYPEWGVIFLLFFLVGLGLGRRWVDLPRAERIIPCLKVSAVAAAFPLFLLILGGTIASLADGEGVNESIQMFFPALVFSFGTFLIFGVPFTAGALLWPRRCKPSVSV